MISLRDYQKEDLGSILHLVEGAATGIVPTKALAIQPTGAGKTVLMIELMRRVWEERKWRSLLVVPNRGLEGQTLERCQQFIPDVMAMSLKEVLQKRRIAPITVTTAGKLHEGTLASLRRDLYPLILMDEAHHGSAKTYRRIFDYFSESKFFLGVTATFRRGDGVSVADADYFGQIIAWRTLGEMTDRGYLVPAKGFYLYSKTDLADVARLGNDYNEAQLAQKVDNPERNEAIVDGWKRYAGHEGGRPTVVFAVNVDHAESIASVFQRKGITSAVASGRQSKEEIRKIMGGYRSGRIKVLVSCLLLIEGWDAPWTSCVVIARPATRAAACVIGPQMIGRALRLSTGKKDAIILEVRDLKRKIKPKLSPSLEDSSLIAEAFEAQEEDLGKGEICQDATKQNQYMRAYKERMKALEQIRKEGLAEFFDVVEKIAQGSQFAWIPFGESLFMQLEGGDFLEVMRESPILYEIRVTRQGVIHPVGGARTIERAQMMAETWIMDHQKTCSLNDRSQGWRQLPPTDAQVQYANQLTGRAVEELQSLKRGMLSDLIILGRVLWNRQGASMRYYG
ncbi:MAG: DEAD/DEAH box helicase [Acidobacteria bacterium]|nr:DEAD/DEAH box helicase [Acidobacteriota bacterium]